MKRPRLILLVTTMVIILVFPLAGQQVLQTLTSPAVQAASSGAVAPADRLYRDDNDGDDNGNGNQNSNDNDDNDNGDITCYASMNSNEEVPCDFVANENQGGGPSPRYHRQDSRTGPTMCFDTRQVGVVQLGTGSYDVTVSVMPHSSFGQTTRLTLRAVDPSSVPAVPGALVDSVVFALDAQSDCSGAAIGTLPNLVNLGITYNVTPAVDKAKLQIAHLEGGAWVNVTTVPDPVAGNPYVSTTIGLPGTYALFQK